MLANASDYGPFAPVVGYAGAIVATGAAIFTLWGGRAKTWRPPDKDLPGAEQKFVLLLCGVFMVVEWHFADPSYVSWMVAAIVFITIMAFVFYLLYSNLLGTYGYHKPVPGPGGPILVLGGRILLPEAEEKRKENGINIQQLLEGAAFDVDKLWDRQNLQWVRTRAIVYFVLTLVLGTSALTMASFTTQVILTKKAATSVIYKSDAPGLEPKKN